MSADSFLVFTLEQLASLDGLRCRKMFGGYGLYSGEPFFGIVYDGRLYFKTHPGTLPDYLSQHCAVFAPSEKQALKNYHEAPVDILEDAEQLNACARGGTAMRRRCGASGGVMAVHRPKRKFALNDALRHN